MTAAVPAVAIPPAAPFAEGGEPIVVPGFGEQLGAAVSGLPHRDAGQPEANGHGDAGPEGDAAASALRDSDSQQGAGPASELTEAGVLQLVTPALAGPLLTSAALLATTAATGPGGPQAPSVVTPILSTTTPTAAPAPTPVAPGSALPAEVGPARFAVPEGPAAPPRLVESSGSAGQSAASAGSTPESSAAVPATIVASASVTHGGPRSGPGSPPSPSPRAPAVEPPVTANGAGGSEQLGTRTPTAEPVATAPSGSAREGASATGTQRPAGPAPPRIVASASVTHGGPRSGPGSPASAAPAALTVVPPVAAPGPGRSAQLEARTPTAEPVAAAPTGSAGEGAFTTGTQRPAGPAPHHDVGPAPSGGAGPAPLHDLGPAPPGDVGPAPPHDVGRAPPGDAGPAPPERAAHVVRFVGNVPQTEVPDAGPSLPSSAATIAAAPAGTPVQTAPLALGPVAAPITTAPPPPVAQLANLVVEQIDQGGGVARLVLDPPELGEIVIRVTTGGDVIRIDVRVDRPETAALLRERPIDLTSLLGERGLDLAELSLSTGSRHGFERELGEGTDDAAPGFREILTGENPPAVETETHNRLRAAYNPDGALLYRV